LARFSMGRPLLEGSLRAGKLHEHCNLHRCGFTTSNAQKRRKKRLKVRLSKSKESKGSKSTKKSNQQDKVLTQTELMMKNLSDFAEQEAELLEERRKAIDKIGPEVGEDRDTELVAVQQEAVAMLQRVLKEADDKLNPIDPKERYKTLPLDTDHFFAALGLPEELKSYNKVIHACAMRGELKKGMEAFEELKKNSAFEPDVYTYSSLILLQRANPGALGVTQALRLREEMYDNGVVPNVNTFGALITVCAKAKDAKRVDALLKEMDEARMAPTPKILTSVLDMYINMNDIPKAWDSYYELVFKGVTPNDVTLCTMLRACAARREVERGLALMNDMKMDHITPSQRAYNHAIILCSKRQDTYLQGFDIFAEMCNEGYTPDNYTLSGLLLCCARAGDVANAMRVCRQFIRTYGMSLDSSHYEHLFNTISTSMELPPVDLYTPSKDEAMEYTGYYGAEASKRRKQNQELSAPESRKDRLKLARGIMSDMKETGVQPTIRVLNQYLRVFTGAAGPPARTGPDKIQKEGGGEEELREAEAMFDALYDEHGMKKDRFSYFYMLRMYCDRRGEEENLERFLDRMKSKDKVAIDKPEYLLLLERYARQEHYEAFLDVLHEMNQKQIEIPKRWVRQGKQMVDEILHARERKREERAIEKASAASMVSVDNEAIKSRVRLENVKLENNGQRGR